MFTCRRTAVNYLPSTRTVLLERWPINIANNWRYAAPCMPACRIGNFGAPRRAERERKAHVTTIRGFVAPLFPARSRRSSLRTSINADLMTNRTETITIIVSYNDPCPIDAANYYAARVLRGGERSFSSLSRVHRKPGIQQFHAEIKKNPLKYVSSRIIYNAV